MTRAGDRDDIRRGEARLGVRRGGGSREENRDLRETGRDGGAARGVGLHEEEIGGHAREIGFQRRRGVISREEMQGVDNGTDAAREHPGQIAARQRHGGHERAFRLVGARGLGQGGWDLSCWREIQRSTGTSPEPRHPDHRFANRSG
jgi:hypothetical protein